MKMMTKFMLGALLLLVAGYSQMAVAGNPNPGVMPINSHAFGKSYGVWGEEFVQWLFSFSLDDLPLFQPDGPANCGDGQTGKVWFLYGGLGGPVTRSCTIPTGKSLFIAVNSAVSYAPDFGNTEEELRADAASDIDAVDPATTFVWIDGLPLNDVLSYRASSPEGGFLFDVPAGSTAEALGIPADALSVVDGYWILLPPLSKGDHAIRWSSSFVGDPDSAYDVTWDITVGKKKK